MEKMNMHTPDLAKENYEKLAALFPNAVTETKDENGETRSEEHTSELQSH